MAIVILILIAVVWGANMIIEKKTQQFIYNDLQTIPSQKAGLLLGASKYARGGINPYFQYRIEAASTLYKAGKIKYIVVSGDNGRTSYNEPEDMKNELIENGVPENAIYLDYAGFRTLDSVVRMNEIFGQKEFIIISQQFHNQRAIYIAQYYGLKVYGYNAKDVHAKMKIKVQIRETFARVKVFVDILIGKAPKFLGEKIVIQ